MTNYIVLKDQYGNSKAFMDREGKICKFNELEAGAKVSGWKAPAKILIDISLKNGLLMNHVDAIYTREAEVVETERGKEIVPIYKVRKTPRKENNE